MYRRLRGEKLLAFRISFLRSLLGVSKNPEPHQLSACNSAMSFPNCQQNSKISRFTESAALI